MPPVPVLALALGGHLKAGKPALTGETLRPLVRWAICRVSSFSVLAAGCHRFGDIVVTGLVTGWRFALGNHGRRWPAWVCSQGRKSAFG